MVELSGKNREKYYGQTMNSKYKIEMAELSGDIQKKDSRPDTQFETKFKWRSCLARKRENNTTARL